MTSDVKRIRDPIELDAPETFAFPFRPQILLDYSRLVTTGLFYWSTGTRVANEDSIRTFFAEKDHDIQLMWEFLFNTDGVRVRGNIGGAGLTFDGLCNIPPHTLSVWRLSFLNGACFSHTNGGYSDAIWSFVALDGAC
jgi:hypothetical protein